MLFGHVAACSCHTGWMPRTLDSSSGHSKRRASCSRLRREPASLSSARKPGGRFSNTSVTSVPPVTSSNVAIIAISPKKAGSSVTKLTGFDDPAGRRQLHEPYVDHVLPVGRLAVESALIRPVEQRHAISAPDPRLEFVDLAGHLCGREPVEQSGRVQEVRVELLGARLNSRGGTSKSRSGRR